MLDRGGDYLFALRANRPAMRDPVAAFFADPPEPLEVFETTDADHGHIETRRHRVTHGVGWLFGDRAEPGAPCMSCFTTLACVEASRDGSPPSTRHYLSSARLTPERVAHTVHAHWAIKNFIHWVLDITFDENTARNRADYGPANLAILRRITSNLLRAVRPKLPVSRKREQASPTPLPEPSSVKCDDPDASRNGY